MTPDQRQAIEAVAERLEAWRDDCAALAKQLRDVLAERSEPAVAKDKTGLGMLAGRLWHVRWTFSSQTTPSVRRIHDAMAASEAHARNEDGTDYQACIVEAEQKDEAVRIAGAWVAGNRADLEEARAAGRKGSSRPFSYVRVKPAD